MTMITETRWVEHMAEIAKSLCLEEPIQLNESLTLEQLRSIQTQTCDFHDSELSKWTDSKELLILESDIACSDSKQSVENNAAEIPATYLIKTTLLKALLFKKKKIQIKNSNGASY